MLKRMTWLAAAAAVFGLMAHARAATVTVTVGDNDGYGVGIPDNGFLGGFAVADTDNRSAAEQAAIDGAQITDVYSAIFPDFGPNTSTIADVIFPFVGQLTSASLTIDMGDFQASTFGAIAAYYNDVLQPGLLAYNDGFQNSAVRTFVLDATALANANAAGQFVLRLDRSGSGDFIAFDYFELNGEATLAPVPEPSTLALGGIAGLLVAGYERRRRRARTA